MPELVAQDWTDHFGDVIFRLPAGNYSVRAKKLWYVQGAREEGWEHNVVLHPRSRCTVNLNMHHLRFYLHVDANRDGDIDDWPEAIDQAAPTWAWGAGNRGAIIPVNVDDDNGTGHRDSSDNVVNGNTDRDSDIAHIEVRRHGGDHSVPLNWTNRLEILSPAGQANPQNYVRIFDGITNNSNQLVGPEAQNAQLPAWPANTTAYGMEAIRYAGHGFNGIVTVRLTVSRPNEFNGFTIYWSEAQVRAAAWLMPNHLDHADTVYVSELPGDPDSQAFINAINPLVTNPAPGGGGSVLSQEAFNDQWMQDCMEIGYSTWPGTGNGILRMESVVRALRDGDLEDMPRTLLGVNFGYTFPGQGGTINTFNSTGNLEVTPPCSATAQAANDAGPKRYNWGRIYYGRGRNYSSIDWGKLKKRPSEPFNTNVRQFLEEQTVQKPIPLNTDWLSVGHVDEMMSFIPTPGHGQEWKLLIASPSRAYDILGEVRDGGYAGGNGNTPVLTRHGNPLQLWVGRYHNGERRLTNVAATVADLLGNGNSPIVDPSGFPRSIFLTWEQLRHWNTNQVQGVINEIINGLVNEIGLNRTQDVIEVPVIFLPEEYLYVPSINGTLYPFRNPPLNINPGQRGGYTCGALTADMVNMLVVNNMLVVPKPFGPQIDDIDVFESYLTQQITQANNALQVHYVDDWDLYHACQGEVHCGTNTLRKPANMNTWLALNDHAKWWEFPGP